MEYQYTVDDLTTAFSISKQSVYNLISKNKEFITQNSIRRQRKVYYNQSVFNFFSEYYNGPSPVEAENKASVGHSDIDGGEIENPAGEAINRAGETENDVLEASFAGEVAQGRIRELEAQILALKTELEAKEAERQELFKQNGLLMLLLQQEKQEKQIYLPAPKKTIGEKIRGLFKK